MSPVACPRSVAEPTAKFFFRLPFGATGPAGRCCPNLHNCRVDVGPDRTIEIACFDAFETFAADQVKKQAARYLATVLARPWERMSVPARLVTPSRRLGEIYAIIVGARIAIAHTASAPALFD
jgi:hypothetical protein